MKFNNIISDLIIEHNETKKTMSYLTQMWRADNPEITDEEIDDIIVNFREKQNGLSPKNSDVYSFLTQYNGENPHSQPKFDEKDLKDITKYSLPQILSLLNHLDVVGYRDSDLKKLEQGIDFLNFNPPNVQNPQNIEKSKSFWDGDRYKIFDKDGLRVYESPTYLTAKAFSYYQKHLVERFGGYNWCIGADTSNTYCSYRENRGRTFYFVIDTTRPENDEKYISSIQISGNEFTLTPRQNGDTHPDWKEIVKTYPQLNGHEEIFINVPYSKDVESPEYNNAPVVDENPRNKYYFGRVNNTMKAAYIGNGGNITKVESWKSMNNTIRKLYIDTINQNNITTKISNLALLKEIMSDSDSRGYLRFRFTTLNLNVDTGIRKLFKNLLQSDYHMLDINFLNPSISLVQSKRSHKYGIFDLRKMDWFNKGNLKYVDEYQIVKGGGDYYDDPNNVEWKITLFKSDNEDSKPFYRFNSDEIKDNGAYFIDEEQWNNIKNNFTGQNELDSEDMETIKRTSDIKETN